MFINQHIFNLSLTEDLFFKVTSNYQDDWGNLTFFFSELKVAKHLFVLIKKIIGRKTVDKPTIFSTSLVLSLMDDFILRESK